jgi:Spy/CpxP family protein refolding chaperone
VTLATALVLVALIARDVVLRVIERPKADNAAIDQLRASMDGETARLSETRAELAKLAAKVAPLPELAEKVEALTTRISMGGKR